MQDIHVKTKEEKREAKSVRIIKSKTMRNRKKSLSKKMERIKKIKVK